MKKKLWKIILFIVVILGVSACAAEEGSKLYIPSGVIIDNSTWGRKQCGGTERMEVARHPYTFT